MPRPEAMAKIPPHTRLAQASFPDRIERVYRDALDALDAAGVEHLLGGAVALNAHTGIWRDTKDLDVFVRPADARAALDALGDAGFQPEVVYESWLGKGWAEDVFVDVIWRNANGLFPVEDAWFEHAHTVSLLRRDVRVIPVEELMVSKMMVCGRNRFDGADMLHILHAAHDRIDWERLADAAGEHVGLLLAYLHMYRWGYPGWRDRVPDHVLAAFEHRADREPSSFGPFRALLLDLQSFRVDVEGWRMPDPHKQALAEIFGDAEGRA